VVALSVPIILFIYFFLNHSFFSIFGAGVILRSGMDGLVELDRTGE